MEDNVIKVIKDRPVVVSRLLLNNYKKMNITDSELIVLIAVMSFGDKVIYDPDEFSKVIDGNKLEIMNIINDLIDKNIISLVVEKNNKKSYEYICIDSLYDKLFNILLDKKENLMEINNSVFSVFENELGRTLSPMEYEQIKEWIISDNNEELIISALKEAVMNGVSNFRYIDSILNDWKKKGYKNKNDIIKDRENYHNKKNKVQVYDTDWLNE